jgi:hypothetical protein
MVVYKRISALEVTAIVDRQLEAGMADPAVVFLKNLYSLYTLKRSSAEEAAPRWEGRAVRCAKTLPRSLFRNHTTTIPTQQRRIIKRRCIAAFAASIGSIAGETFQLRFFRCRVCCTSCSESIQLRVRNATRES